MTRPVMAGRKQVRDEQWNWGSVKAVLNRIQESKAKTEIDTSVARQEYTTNSASHEHRCAPLCTRCAWDTEVHCRTRFEIMWTKEFAGTQVANRIVDAGPIDPTVRVGNSVEPAAAASGQPAAMERNTTNDQTGTRKLERNPVVERDGGASCRLDENQLQTMDVSLNQNATSIATKQREEHN